jgi:hypothetical protein
MSDQYHSTRKRAADAGANAPEGEATPDRRTSGGPDFAEQMARAEFGRHYVDTGRIEQALRRGEIVFQHKAPSRRGKLR